MPAAPRWCARGVRASIVAACIVFAGCAADAAWRADLRTGWRQRVETGTQFRHRTIFKPGRGDTLHIYLDGDGDIWRTAGELNFDPTPSRSLALQLMQRDPAPALLIGRPCYLEVTDARCRPYWWTSARYSQPVIDSLGAVAQRWSQHYRQVTLIGYSGGGALAVLLAPQLPRANSVITVAANLDLQAWKNYHRYSAAVIDASIDPDSRPALPARIAQWHYAGADDGNVLPQWIEHFSARQRGAHYAVLPHVDHRCCWVRRWPALLTQSRQYPGD